MTTGTGIWCDVCGNELKDYTDDNFHCSGTLDGQETGHIHLCRTCYEDKIGIYIHIDSGEVKSINVQGNVYDY